MCQQLEQVGGKKTKYSVGRDEIHMTKKKGGLENNILEIAGVNT